jgi:hypothetical protein
MHLLDFRNAMRFELRDQDFLHSSKVLDHVNMVNANLVNDNTDIAASKVLGAKPTLFCLSHPQTLSAGPREVWVDRFQSAGTKRLGPKWAEWRERWGRRLCNEINPKRAYRAVSSIIITLMPEALKLNGPKPTRPFGRRHADPPVARFLSRRATNQPGPNGDQ